MIQFLIVGVLGYTRVAGSASRPWTLTIRIESLCYKPTPFSGKIAGKIAVKISVQSIRRWHGRPGSQPPKNPGMQNASGT